MALPVTPLDSTIRTNSQVVDNFLLIFLLITSNYMYNGLPTNRLDLVHALPANYNMNRMDYFHNRNGLFKYKKPDYLVQHLVYLYLINQLFRADLSIHNHLFQPGTIS